MRMLCHKCHNSWEEEFIPGQNAVECPKCHQVLMMDDFTGTVSIGSVLPAPRSVSREEILKELGTPMPFGRTGKTPPIRHKAPAKKTVRPVTPADAAPRTSLPTNAPPRRKGPPEKAPDTGMPGLRTPSGFSLSDLATRVYYPDRTRLEDISPVQQSKPKVSTDLDASGTHDPGSVAPATAIAIDLANMKTPLAATFLTPPSPASAIAPDSTTISPDSEAMMLRDPESMHTRFLPGPPPGMIESLLEDIRPATDLPFRKNP